MKRLCKLVGLLVTVSALWGCQPTQSLLSSVDERGANETLMLLQRHGIQASKHKAEKGMYSVDVAPADFARAVDVLGKYGQPLGRRPEISGAFPSDALVATPLAERARLTSAIEQRLEHTLRSIDHVVGASVHVAYQLAEDSRSKERSPRVGILITHEGDIDEQLFIERIKRLVKGSLSDVSYEDISVVLFKRAPTHFEPGGEVRPAPRGGWAKPSFVVALVGAFGVLAVVIVFTLVRFRARTAHADAPPTGVRPS